MSPTTLAERTRHRDAARDSMRRLREARRQGVSRLTLTPVERTPTTARSWQGMVAARLDEARRRGRFVTIEHRPKHCRFCSHKTSNAERICSFCRAELEGGGLLYCRDLLEQLGASLEQLPADVE